VYANVVTFKDSVPAATLLILSVQRAGAVPQAQRMDTAAAAAAGRFMDAACRG